jgi:hypothetical protein
LDKGPERICISKAADLAGSLSSMNTSTIVLPQRREVIWIAEGGFFNARAISFTISVLNSASFDESLISLL